MSEVKANKLSPSSGTAITLGDSGDTFTVPSGATLNTSSATLSIPASVITGATALDDVPETTDEFLISDAGTLKKIDANFIMNTPSFFAYKTASTTIANNTTVQLIPTSIVQNDGSAYDSSTGRFTIPTGQDGLYFLYGAFRINNYDPNRTSCVFFVNGSETNWSLTEHAPEGGLTGRRPVIHTTHMASLSAGDYVDFRGAQASGSSDTVLNIVFGGFKIR